MKAKVLSIYQNEYEIKDFLLKYDFISKEEYEDEDYDLLRLLEGDCDRLTYNNTDIYFSHFHSDYEIDGCYLVICTAEWKDELNEVEDFYNGDGWKKFEGESVEEFESLDRERYGLAYYRGGVGYVYNLYVKDYGEN